MTLNNTIWLLWLQGWTTAPWLQKQVSESWQINNPDWKVIHLDADNLKDYISDIEYIYDKQKNITMQAISDIIRLSLLKNHGGVWADSTMLCMQPLNHWVYDAIKPSGIWMYHGHGAGLPKEIGPASWFIISEPSNPLIIKWKLECDKYWTRHNSTNNYFWMDTLFKELYQTDNTFKDLWNNVPYLYCETYGQSHTLAHHSMFKNNSYLKNLFLEKPPYALKFWNIWNNVYPDIDIPDCQNSNGYCAIQLSKRKYIYNHIMT